MEIFELYDVLEAYMVSEWREQIEKEDKRGFIKQKGTDLRLISAYSKAAGGHNYIIRNTLILYNLKNGIETCL